MRENLRVLKQADAFKWPCPAGDLRDGLAIISTAWVPVAGRRVLHVVRRGPWFGHPAVHGKVEDIFHLLGPMARQMDLVQLLDRVVTRLHICGVLSDRRQVRAMRQSVVGYGVGRLCRQTKQHFVLGAYFCVQLRDYLVLSSVSLLQKRLFYFALAR